MYENEKENKSDSHIDISISYKVICSFDELTTHDCKWLTSIHVPFLFMKKRLPLWMPFFSIYEYGVIKYIFTFGLIECSMCMYSDNWCWVFHHVGNVQFWPKYIAIWIFGSSQTFIIWPSKKIKKKSGDSIFALNNIWFHLHPSFDLWVSSKGLLFGSWGRV